MFLLNDQVLDFEHGPAWLAGDYAIRCAAVAICFAAARPDVLRLVRPASLAEAMGWAVMLTVITAGGGRLLMHFFPDAGLNAYPAISSPVWLALDTAIGIPLVALSEELVARGAFLAWAERRGWTPGPIILGSAVLFAAFHWSLGTASIVAALLFGVIAMFSVMVTRSLWPAIAAHWAADLLLFSLPSWLNWMRWAAG
ncbi:MAG: CPBP family intramembrane glutamic endopeptidase [Pseudomonadota bacterium]